VETLLVCKQNVKMSEIKFKKPRRKVRRTTTLEDSDEDRSDDESLKLVWLIRSLWIAQCVQHC